MTTASQTQEPSPEQALEALMLDGDLERLEDQLAEFNLFEALGIWHRELQHSWLLAWLLDPRESHGLGDYFLRAFLSQAAREARERGISVPTPFDVDGWTLSDIEVARERHYIDVLVVGATDGFVCLIENKIFSPEAPGQLSSYRKTVKSVYAGLTPFPIFLTPAGLEPMDAEDRERYVPFDYGKVADLVERTLETREAALGASVVSFMEQYADILRRRILNTPGYVDKLALRLYRRHRKAIDLIDLARKNAPGAAGDVIVEVVAANAPHLKPDYHDKGFWRFFADELEGIPDLKKAERWTKSGRLLLFEFRQQVGGEGLTFYLWIGPGPDETREQIHQLALDKGANKEAPFATSEKLYKDWQFIYERPVLSELEYPAFDPEEARPKIEQAVREFYERDYWPIVNAVREEFKRNSDEATPEPASD